MTVGLVAQTDVTDHSFALFTFQLKNIPFALVVTELELVVAPLVCLFWDTTWYLFNSIPYPSKRKGKRRRKLEFWKGWQTRMDWSQNLIEENLSILHSKLKATFQLRIHLQTWAWIFNEKESKTHFNELSRETFKHLEFVTPSKINKCYGWVFCYMTEHVQNPPWYGFLSLSENAYKTSSYTKYLSAHPMVSLFLL